MTALLLVSASAIPSLEVKPSPVATVTGGSVLWLTCTYDLDGGTLGQLLWRDKDSAVVATATPTSTPPHVIHHPLLTTPQTVASCPPIKFDWRSSTLYTGYTYSCVIYLSDFTPIGPVSTQVSVVVPVPSVTFTPPISEQ
ncbi:uncharacterized protein [Argopecten irradians]|uniref:uncharacterized protein n=1 Tax=Argopecten irradians TaxID=31199 RepID=UPI0037131436